MKNKEYFIGLDIGTNSIGWAVTDTSYNILKKNRKFLYGVRLFDEAQTAVERRVNRNNRRRLKRRNERLKFLKNSFEKYILKKDPLFFERLDDSFFYEEDKRIKQKNTLFNDEKFNDKDFHKKYPTIYHLRYELMNSKEEHDVREVYLAIAHILKNRGHFLFENFEVSDSKKINNRDTLKELIINFEDYIDTLEDIDFEIKDIDKFCDILLDSNMRRKDKETNLKSLVNGKDKIIIRLLIGFETQLDKIYINNEAIVENKVKINFSSSNYDEKYSEIEATLGDDIELIDKSKEIYDYVILQKILKDSNSISESKVKLYAKYKEDLIKVKYFIKKYFGDENYKLIFNSVEYRKKVLEIKESKFKELKIDDEDKEISDYIINSISEGTLLELQKSISNSVIPMQLHLYELKKILDNASNYLMFLNEVDNTNLSLKEKIIQIFEFRIPYFIGPLNDRSEFSWLERNDYKAKVYPWNFNQVINVKKSAENFITRMTRKCSYLHNENALAKNSLLYSKFMVLNELNNVKINGERLSTELKQKIYNECYLLNEKMSKNKLKKMLKLNNLYDDIEITGVDELNASLKSHIDMYKILGEDFKKDSYKELAENVIFWITVYNGDKKMILEKITEVYSSMLTQDQINKLSSLKYSGWGNLSRKFLTEVEHYGEETAGEYVNLIDMMWDYSLNLMELLSNKYKFLESLDELKEVKVINKLNYEDIMEDLVLSPSVKRSVWQTLRIIGEIKKIMKYDPKKVFVEVTRKEDIVKTRKDKRKKQLEEKYKNIKDVDKNILEELKNTDEKEFRRKKLYLYFTQMGRCMYSGENIHLEDLFNSNIYDIDHIYPRSLTKDDSWNNLVLVRKDMNLIKSNGYELIKNIRDSRKDFWTSLKNKGLISDIKYERLIGSEELTPEILEKFIARQLVETSQTIKNVIEVLKTMFTNTQMCYVKAEGVSEFRKRYEYFKVREINDLHHAHDAYLNIIVGNVYNEKFTRNPILWLRKNRDETKNGKNDYNLEKMFDNDIFIKDRKIFDKEEVNKKIERFLYQKFPLVTKRTKEEKGAISDLQLISKKAVDLKNMYIPIKGNNSILANNLEKYGAFNKVSGSYFALVSHIVKKKRVRTLETIPVYISKKIKNKEDLILYFEEKIKLIEPKILIEKIPIKSVFKINSCYYTLRGRTGNDLMYNLDVQLKLGKVETNYIKNIIKFNETGVNRKDKNNNFIITVEYNKSLFEEIINKITNTIFYYRNNKGKENAVLKILDKDKFDNLDLKSQCSAIIKILGYFSNSRDLFDLSDFGGAQLAGILKFGKNIENLEEIKLISKSITGVYETEIDLKKL